MGVTDEEVKRYFEENAKRFQEPEERRASHILIGVPANASAAIRDAAKKKADQVYQEAKQNPNKFAELAKKYSQDPGSAEQGEIWHVRARCHGEALRGSSIPNEGGRLARAGAV